MNGGINLDNKKFTVNWTVSGSFTVDASSKEKAILDVDDLIHDGSLMSMIEDEVLDDNLSIVITENKGGK